ncbi:uncharacterized protein ALTATR162_LOCUS10706 [Alternaria atra]|uniref:AA1-like domain-containing protein n=1 Tax=Alternaria atra TaxID=119953 RepID=A0A8J2N4I0_9PLEO|nr:uncharacterized protein ALTATR162_LOCUS8039 [Alternaria atra]XP_043174279.1 uncharacterized protein ALTATR162_LOCUS10706 [Alternaria atra]CAG5175291.1 unnamed protein product [Alternaria atra]CAG5183691.1 unnamed protein product [Alternaria atra]
MYASVLSLALSLAPAVVAATPSNYGGWNVTIEDNNFEYGYRSTNIDALYIDASTASGEPVAAGCKTIKRPGAAPADTGCSPASFNYTLDGDAGVAGSYSLALEQTVTFNGTGITVYGAKLIEIQCTPHPEEDLPYTQCKGTAIVRVDKAGDQIIE